MASIKVLQPGLYTTVQDEGRSGYGHLGIPESGAIDKTAMHLANTLLNNKPDTAIIEYTLIGPVLQFEDEVFFVLTGGIVTALLDNEHLEMYTVYKGVKGQKLNIGSMRKGSRGYLGFAGGITTPNILGSKSYYYPVTDQSTLIKGQLIPIGNHTYRFNQGARLRPQEAANLIVTNDCMHIEVYQGPEFDDLTTSQQNQLFDL